MNIDKDIDEAHENYMEHIANERKKEKQSLLDRLAGLAMQGICVNAGIDKYPMNREDKIAEVAYNIAEYMVEERERRVKGA